MSIELAKVPAPIRRKAAQHLESIRGTPMAPNAANARLADEVWPIYRPDLEEVAYYEFSVDLGSRAEPARHIGGRALRAARHGAQDG